MRSNLRWRARMLVVGAGVLLVGSLTGCWSTPSRPEPRMPSKTIPKTNVSAVPGASAGGYPAAGQSGSAVNRVSGAPAGGNNGPVGAGSTMGSGGTSGAAGAPAYFQQGAAGGNPNGVQPIATSNNPGTKTIQPVANFGPVGSNPGDPVPPPDKLPLDSKPRELPPVAPISLQNADRKVSFERKSPVIPMDDNATALPQPKMRNADEPLGPPPLK